MMTPLLSTADARQIRNQLAAGSNQTRATAETLPPAAYCSEAFYALEMEAIFRGDWVCVGHVATVPEVGDYYAIDIAGEPLVVVRGEDRIRVLSRVCQHRWAPVVSGAGRVKIFSCPFHKWAYGLDGQLLAAPFMEGSESFDKTKCPLPEVRTEIVDDLGLIFLTFSSTTESIGERLADFRARYGNFKLGDLASIRVNAMDSAFNWKIQVETFMECYHHIGAHPTTFEVDQPARLSSCDDGKAGWSVCHSPYRAEAPPEAKMSGLPMFPDLVGPDRDICDYVNIFPNALLAIRPDIISLLVLFPEGPRRTAAHVVTLAHRDALADPPAIEASFARKADFMALAMKEDNAINELQQSGVTSRLARPGRLSQLETTVWDLANYVRRRVSSLETTPGA